LAVSPTISIAGRRTSWRSASTRAPSPATTSRKPSISIGSVSGVGWPGQGTTQAVIPRRASPGRGRKSPAT